MVYVGDSRVDIRAGRAAGTKTVGVLTGADSYDVLLAEGADAILESVGDLGSLLASSQVGDKTPAKMLVRQKSTS
jgi:phosphoglycolate phosphatase